jgi:putative ATP-dependent endonuclease of OLD family
MTDGDRNVGKQADEDDEAAENGQASAEVGDDAAPAADPQAEDGAEPIIPGERRKLALDALAKGNGASQITAAISSRYSLESELLEAGNGAILRAAYLTLHKRSAKKWDAAVALVGDARAQAVQAIFEDARKGDFAQVLADLIEDGKHSFTVPAYIDQTIREVVA